MWTARPYSGWLIFHWYMQLLFRKHKILAMGDFRNCQISKLAIKNRSFTWLLWGSCAAICVVVIWQLVGSENVWLKFVTGKLIWLWCAMPTTVKWFPPVVCGVDEHDWKDGALCSAWEVMLALGKTTFCIAWYGSGFCGNLVWTFCCLLGPGADLGWLKELATDVATFLWGPRERSFTESITATPELLTLFNTFCW